MNQLAGVLDDFDLIRWPRKRSWRHPFQNNELTMLKAEEDELSDTDLTEIRKKHLERLEQQGIDISDAQSFPMPSRRRSRKRGLCPITASFPRPSASSPLLGGARACAATSRSSGSSIRKA